MGLTIYLLDRKRQLKRAISRGIAELIHNEGEGTLQAEIAIGTEPHAGEYIAFSCVDGRDRLFEIDTTDQVDEEGVDYIEAVDASIAELRTTICTSAEVKNKNADAAMAALLAGTGWQIGKLEANGYVGNIKDAEYESIWDVMERIADTAKVKLEPYYELTGGKVTGKKIDLLSAEPVYRGLIISRRNASGIVLTEQGAPMGRVYALGGWTGTGSERKRVTLESVAWSKAAGDPVDKPAGQKYIDLEGWDEPYRRAFVYTDTNTDDALKLAQDAYEEAKKRNEPKRTGTAMAGDLFFVNGGHHSAVRVDDWAGLRTMTGVVRERVANIRRDYVWPELTELEFGERQSKSWIQTEYQQQAIQTNEAISRLRGGYSSLSSVVEDTGVELYRAVEQLVELENETATQFNEVWIDLNAQAGKLELKANTSTVTELGEQVTSVSAELNSVLGKLELKVDADGVINAINISKEGVQIDAIMVDLGDYAKVATLDASISNMLYNYSQAIETLLLSADKVDTTYLDVDSITFGEDLLQRRQVVMGDITTTNKAVVTGEMDLSHSHDVTVADDGTVTLGKAQKNGGNFKIADTKAYKEGVSAAKTEGANSVTISRGTWNGGELRPTTSTGKGIDIQLSASKAAWSGNKQVITIYDQMGTDGEQSVSTGYTVTADASALVANAASGVIIQSYSGWKSSGVNTVTLSNGKTGNVSLPSFTYNSGSWSSGNRTVTVYWQDNNGTNHTAKAVQVSMPTSASFSWSNPQQNYAVVKCTVGGKTYTSDAKNISGFV